MSFFRSTDGLKSFDKLKQEKDRENAKLNKLERKQDKMLFVAFYILLNLVSKWMRIESCFNVLTAFITYCIVTVSTKQLWNIS